MRNIYLKKPDIFDIDKIDFFSKDYINHNYKASITKDNFKDMLKEWKLAEKGLSTKKKNIKWFTYFIMLDEEIIGEGSIRLNPEDDEEYYKYAGHIGYGIMPSMRNKGYGSIACHLLLEECQKLGLKEVAIFCNEMNIGSQKIIENNMGILDYSLIYDDETTNRVGMLFRKYIIDVNNSISKFNEDNYNSARIKPSIEQICNIDRNALNYFLTNKWQNIVGSSLSEFVSQIKRIDTLNDLKQLYSLFLKNIDISLKEEVINYGRTSEEIFLSHKCLNEHEIGILLSSILRLKGIPTLYVQAVNIDQIRNLDGWDKIKTHVFLEIYLEDRWHLLDFVNGVVYTDYDYNNLSLPNNCYAFSKSLNSFTMGIVSAKDNEYIIKERFIDFDLSKYHKPDYEIVRL